MPILDHFHPPLGRQRRWQAFYHAWASVMARHLNRYVLPQEYVAAANVQFRASHTPAVSSNPMPGEVGVSPAPEPPTLTVPTVFPDTIEVVIGQQAGGLQVVAAVQLVSPSNKEHPEACRAFAGKMATYLQQGSALAVVDLVTDRAANLHNAWVTLMGLATGQVPELSASPLYANAYRPVQRHGRAEIDLWLHALYPGACLPDVPLFLRADLWINLPLEVIYVETCQEQRLVLP